MSKEAGRMNPTVARYNAATTRKQVAARRAAVAADIASFEAMRRLRTEMDLAKVVGLSREQGQMVADLLGHKEEAS